jgi:transposase
MSRRKRQNYSAEFKAKVAIDALKEQKTLSELAQFYQIHPNQITTWKKEFLEHASQIFEKGNRRPKDDVEVSKLFDAIGQLKIENDWLKKSYCRVNLEQKRAMIDKNHSDLNCEKQCVGTLMTLTAQDDLNWPLLGIDC